MTGRKVILHLDMDAFFASVEQRDFPELRGKPVLVGGGRGGTGKRGVVTTASYEARVFGCRSAMPMAQARRLCPQAIVQPVRMGVYSEASDIVMGILRELSPTVQPVSIDEAFADLSGVLHLHGCTSEDETECFAAAQRIGKEVKRLVRERTNLPCSVGVAGSKSLAKIASDTSKPDGLGTIVPSKAMEILAPMKVGVLYTLGPKAQAKLEARGIRTIADLRALGLEKLDREFGESGRFWWELAHGRDERDVRGERDDAKSISKERTFGDDVDDLERLRRVLADQVEETSRRLRSEGLLSRRVTLKLRLGDFSTFTRSRTLKEPTDQTNLLWAAAEAIFAEWVNEERGAIRLLGTSLGDLGREEQLELFGAPPERVKASRADVVADAIVKRFGREAIKRGGSIERPAGMVSNSDQNAKNRTGRKL